MTAEGGTRWERANWGRYTQRRGAPAAEVAAGVLADALFAVVTPAVNVNDDGAGAGGGRQELAGGGT